MVGEMQSRPERSSARRVVMAVLVAVLLGVGALPAPAAESERPRGYLVFSDTRPVGPDLDVTFHVVVPDGSEVLSARIDLWGRVGTLPAASGTDVAGEHTHILATTGGHAHTTADADAHNHTVPSSGQHGHTVTTYGSTISLNTARMSVALPAHTHTPFGSSVLGYDFAPATSLEHNHTALDHGHSASISTSGSHGHTSGTVADHIHGMAVEGEHSHVSSNLGEHAHTLSPGIAPDPSGSVPSGVRVTIVSASASTTLGGTFGQAGPGWHASADLQGLLGGGVTRVVLTSDTAGALEYLLVLGVDTPCSIIAGHGVVGPLAPLEVPVYSPDVPTSATAYMFGAALPSIVPRLNLTEGHGHVALEDGSHAHGMDGAGSHTHDTLGGDHTHEATVGIGAVTVMDTTPDWSLIQHSHSLAWAGNQITSVGSWAYGTVDSTPHTHTVLGHDHSVTIASTGDHGHVLSDVAGHTHTMDQIGAHAHDVGTAGAHGHAPVYEPAATTGPGPTGVRAALDGSDLTDANGGPWGLVEAPVEVGLSAAALVGQHVLRLTASTDGAVEWVIVLKHAQTRLVASLRSVGDLIAHVPVPVGALSAESRVFASPYVMAVKPTSSTDGRHSHSTSSGGGHDHDVTSAGGHSHALDYMQHDHELSLANETVTVVNSTGTVDLPAHTHTVAQGSQSTGLSRVTGTTGMHTHVIEDHTHGVEWDSSGAHDHPVDVTADHAHVLSTVAGHTHTMSGGGHEHALTPGAVGSAAYPSPSDVTLTMGAASATGLHPAQDATWWDYADMSTGLSGGATLVDFNASSGTLGTLNVIVVISVDSEPPVLSLASAPQWVRPGQSFQVGVAASEDIDVATVGLLIAGVTVSGPVLNATSSVIEFLCTCREDAPDGVHPMLAKGSDLAGNPFEGVIGSIIVDGTPPTIDVRLGVPSVTTAGRTWVSPLTIVLVDLNDSGSGGGPIRYGSSPTQLDTPWDPSRPRILEGLAEGPHELWFGGFDLAGNPTAKPARLSVWLDSTPPEVAMELSDSVTTTDPPVTLVGPESVLLLSAEDPSDGPGLARIEYKFENGTTSRNWRVYTAPLRLGDAVDGTPSEAVLTWRALDAVGNEATVVANLTFDWNSPMLPDVLYRPPEYTNQDDLPVHFFASSDATWALFRVGMGAPFSVPLVGYGDVDTRLHLAAGPNMVFLALKDSVGNTSPWVILGVVTLDKEAPYVSTYFPGEGLDEVKPGYVVVSIGFSEPIRQAYGNNTVRLNDDPAGMRYHFLFHEGGTALAIVSYDPVPGGSRVDIHLEFEDMAGNLGTHDMNFTMPGEEQEVSTGDFLWGLVIGLVLGIVAAYLVALRLNRGGAPRRPTGPRPLLDMGLRPAPSILAPDEERLDSRPEVAPAGERPDGGPKPPKGTEGAEEGLLPRKDEGPEEGRGDSGRSGGKDGGPVEGALAGADDGPEHHHLDEDEVDEELSADIDRLIEQATSPSSPEVSREFPADGADDDAHLPDPDEETVDPGAR